MIWRAKCTLKRQKSMSSHAASISAWYAVLLCPSIVAALIRARHGPARRSAALRRIAARSSKDRSRQAGAAAFAASTAAAASAFVAPRATPTTLRWACGWRTSILGPLPVTRAPPIVCGRSCLVAASSTSATSSAARSALPGA